MPRLSKPIPQVRHPRAAVEAEIERLIGILDKIDGDADLEPSLGSVTAWNGDQRCWSEGDQLCAALECEGPDEREPQESELVLHHGMDQRVLQREYA